MRTTLAFLAVLTALAVPAVAGATYTGPFYSCTNGETVKPHQGTWHAAQLEKQGWTCTLNQQAGAPACASAANAAGVTVCPVTPAESSSPMCRILDANEPAQAILDSEILDPVVGDGSRSLANGWKPAAYDHGKFVCEPVANPTAWTDDSLSMYDAPNTAYANPVAP